ncbi:MAG: phage baseplate assembly protein V [Gammaproteobacteria bacterium]|nr:phage baseplate assembly protein V [Gammaproteobacteria bacterium]
MRARANSHNFGASYQEGIVCAIDAAKHRVRVQFPHLDNLESDWLAVRADSAYKNRSYDIPDEGSLVGCILDNNGETGMVLGCIYNDKDTPPADDNNLWVKEFSNGTRIEHNRSSGTVNISGCNTINITCPTNNVNGNINVNNGTITVSGGDVIADGISLKGHKHISPETGVPTSASIP